ncbi:MAG TPA: class I SAM-dependent methyltransferase [Candidatus Ozemobacteraceae bacterium]|nr:class I SAM-dependent methyltransferase [Candidatus Ozemobacteraceae bacterium]
MKCKICGNTENLIEFHIQEKMFGSGAEFIYFQCSQCQCLQIKDIPENMEKYYPHDYYSYRKISKTLLPGLKQALLQLKNRYALFGNGVLGKLLSLVSYNQALESLKILNIARDSRIMDVGCGSGALLCSMKNLGFTHLAGIDPFIREKIVYDSGLVIHKQNIHQIKDTWDIVMFHHSFEHMPDPCETLKSVSQILSDNGWCVVRIPTVSSYAWSHYRENWVQLDAPRHLFLHSIESMQYLAALTRLELVDVVFDSTAFQFWGSEQYQKGIALGDKNSYGIDPARSIFSQRKMLMFARKAKMLNRTHQGDQAAFYFRRRRV